MEDTRLIGRVNWFDSKKGFGFITVMTNDHENTGKDIFIHYTSIIVDSSYKKVFPWEYVEFELDSNCEGKHNEQAVNVTGICGKELQCDFIHRLNKKKKTSKKTDEEDDE